MRPLAVVLAGLLLLPSLANASEPSWVGAWAFADCPAEGEEGCTRIEVSVTKGKEGLRAIVTQTEPGKYPTEWQ